MTDDAKSGDNSEDGRDKAIRDVSLRKVKFSFKKRIRCLHKLDIIFLEFFGSLLFEVPKNVCRH